MKYRKIPNQYGYFRRILMRFGSFFGRWLLPWVEATPEWVTEFKKWAKDRKILGNSGALGRIRTSDTRIRSPMLYPLSYERQKFIITITPYKRNSNE